MLQYGMLATRWQQGVTTGFGLRAGNHIPPWAGIWTVLHNSLETNGPVDWLETSR